ncbi:sodium/hydrogen exchanger 9B2-like isoform X3 [Vanessa atalanta]|uniref:sodium/hydrogen exchanger 9B2-like isoform X3 n=1 Tax=Vanessa atalanta TaxID=42275 RepID=UPI001FCD17E3|nr:sodium/hydrogen exchanger 9B2-like isoform X3 [Vanessa atalanta]
MAPELSEIDINKTKKNRLTVTFEMNSKTKRLHKNEWKNTCLQKMSSTLPSVSEVKQYISVFICATLLWATSWFVFKETVLPGSDIFTMIALIVIGYVFGHTLERYTTINPVVGMTLVGALGRIFSPKNFLDNPSANGIDFHLRRIYPVIILTKGPLSWNWKYIKNNSVKVFTLATLPWIIECLTTAFLTHVFFAFPWYWGIHLGAILSSVSPAVVVPTTIALGSKGFGVKNQISLLVANAGGLDTAFTEGMFGVINSAIFSQSPPIYRIVKALLAIFIGIGLGVTWGVLADFLPDHSDFYAPAIRSLHIFAGGTFIMYAGGYLSWGGISGVAIMVCAGAAATRWARRDWPINNNPVSEVYKLLWRIFEPMLFTLSGYFLEAVLVRVAADSLWTEGTTAQDRWIARHHANMIVIAILLTSTLGSILTTVLGPILLSNDAKVVPEDLFQPQTCSVPPHSDFVRENNTLDTLQYIDAQ